MTLVCLYNSVIIDREKVKLVKKDFICGRPSIEIIADNYDITAYVFSSDILRDEAFDQIRKELCH